MTVLLMALAFVSVVITAYLLWVVDCVVRWEHEHCHDDWVRDGKPNGFFWTNSECTFFWSTFSRNRLALRIACFSTPNWARNIRCRMWILQLRAFGGVLIGGIIAFVLVRLHQH